MNKFLGISVVIGLVILTLIYDHFDKINHDKIVKKNLDCVTNCVTLYPDGIRRQNCYEQCVLENPIKDLKDIN